MLVPVFQPTSRHDVDVALEEISQFEFKMNLIEDRGAGVEFDEEVDIAVGPIVTARDGPKHHDVVGAVSASQGLDLVGHLAHSVLKLNPKCNGRPGLDGLRLNGWVRG